MGSSQHEAAMSPHNTGDTKRIKTGKRRDPARLDGRTRAARRVRQLCAEFTAALDGDVDAVTATKLGALAEMLTEAEMLRAKALSGEATDVLARIRLENVIGRLRRELGVDRPRPKPPLMPWQALMQRRAA